MSITTFPRPFGRRRPSRRVRALALGWTGEKSWARVGLVVLLAATGAAYLWNLTSSGDANSFYAAAVQAGTKSWKALLFGSLDSSNFITVDKPPASLWVMALSGRIFGFSSASMLVPQVLEGVLAVGLLSTAVKRWFGAGAGLLAGALLALTPVAALMFRFNNPDALLVCLLVAAAYCLIRALERGSTRWLVAVGTLLGFAFLSKMMQAFLVLPGFAAVYLLAAPGSFRRRATQLLTGGLAIVVSAGWWVALVALWPVGSRPMIDGSPDNSIFNLIMGYNGLGRIFGGSGPGGGGGGTNFSGATGIFRLFNEAMGGQASWLLPAALLVLVGGLWHTRRAGRSDRTRAALLLWGSWLVVSGAVFSLSRGVIHTYYTVALAPAIAALVAIGVGALWRGRRRLRARAVIALGVLTTSVWAIALLERTSSWEPWLRPLVVAAAVLATFALLAPQARTSRRVVQAGAVLALIACLAGPLAYSVQTLATAHTGSIPSAGPATAGGGGLGTPGGGSVASGGGAARGGGSGGSVTSSSLARALENHAARYRWVAATSGSQSAASLELATGGQAVMAIGGFNSQGGNINLAQFERYVRQGDIHYYIVSAGGPGSAGGGAGASAGGAAGAASHPSASVGGGAGASAGGPGPAGQRGGVPSGAMRARLGRAGGSTGAPAGGVGGSSSSSAITAWVKAHFKSVTIGGQTAYDLTQAR